MSGVARPAKTGNPTDYAYAKRPDFYGVFLRHFERWPALVRLSPLTCSALASGTARPAENFYMRVYCEAYLEGIAAGRKKERELTSITRHGRQGGRE